MTWRGGVEKCGSFFEILNLTVFQGKFNYNSRLKKSPNNRQFRTSPLSQRVEVNNLDFKAVVS